MPEQPRRRTTLVRFVETLPYCGTTPHATSPEERAKLAGQEVRIYLPPYPADPRGYTCDSELCWDLVAGELERLTGKAEARNYSVCKHAIECD